MTSPATGRPRPRPRLLWALMALPAAAVAVVVAIPYLTGDTAGSRIPLDPDIALHYLVVASHAVPGCAVLLIGPFQFAARLRARRPDLHRLFGRIYLVGVLFAAVTAVLAATFSVSGFSARVGFYVISAAWVYTLVKAYLAIRRHEVGLHRLWMVRNFALTFGAVALRVLLALGLLLRQQFPSISFEAVYDTSVWGGVLLCTLVAEYFISHRIVEKAVARRGSAT